MKLRRLFLTCAACLMLNACVSISHGHAQVPDGLESGCCSDVYAIGTGMVAGAFTYMLTNYVHSIIYPTQPAVEVVKKGKGETTRGEKTPAIVSLETYASFLPYPNDYPALFKERGSKASHMGTLTQQYEFNFGDWPKKHKLMLVFMDHIDEVDNYCRTGPRDYMKPVNFCEYMNEFSEHMIEICDMLHAKGGDGNDLSKIACDKARRVPQISMGLRKQLP